MADPVINPPTRQRKQPKSVSNQSLNHLLNFSLPPRQPRTNLPRRSNNKRAAGNAYGARSTERFVNAQYRFVMRPSGDYTIHFTDPDVFLQWQDVLQVLIPRTSAFATAASHQSDEGLTTCPICISPPTAARMTKCGHVFCFPCILHYLNISDIDKWIRCPICFDSVNEKQLKSVKWYAGHSLETDAGDSGYTEEKLDLNSTSSNARRNLRMRLMQRPQISTLALPRSPTWPSDLISPHQAPFHFLPDVYTFSKFMLATPEYVIADLRQDLAELRAERIMLQSMNDDLGILFVDAAASKVQIQLQMAEEMSTELLRYAMDKAYKDLADIQRRDARTREALARAQLQIQGSDDAPSELLSLNSTGNRMQADIAARSSAKSRRNNVNPPPPSSSTYYYYQSASGSPIFLHPLDIKILLSHFNSHSSFPNEITVEVEGYSEGSVNDELRKRCKYLALPDGADVVFVEANLENVVGAETVKNFEGALKTRRVKRKEKARKDDRAKLRAEETERDRVYGPAQWGDGDAVSFSKIPDLTSVEPLESGSQPTSAVVLGAPQGAWGSRSFASALHSMPSSTTPTPRVPKRDEAVEDDEWDIDAAWHDLQQQGGGRKQGRRQKLVILGGGPNTGRRR